MAGAGEGQRPPDRPTLARATALHREGRLREAVAAYDAHLSERPHDVAALHACGLACAAAGLGSEAIDRLARAVALAPERVALHSDLGAALQLVGRLDDAIAQFETAARLAADDAMAWHNLGVARATRGDDELALVALRRVAALKPQFAPTHLSLGEVLQRLGRTGEAVAAWTRGAELASGSARAWSGLARALVAAGIGDEALRAARRAVALDPNGAAAAHALAAATHAMGDREQTLQAARRALSLDPMRHETWLVIAQTLRVAGDLLGAIDAAERALKLAPEQLEARIELARCQIHADRFEAALRTLEAADRAHADDPRIAFWRGQARQALGDAEGAIADLRGVLAQVPGHTGAIRALLTGLLYAEGDPASVRDAAVRWGEAFAARFASGRAVAVVARRAGPLRIGYVSPDLRAHSVAWFLLPVLEAHDRAAVEPHLYRVGTHRGDAITTRFRELVGARWHDVAELPTSAVVERIAADGIDVLVDLAGHMQDSRLDVFASRAAPVQLSWLGWPATTGLAAIDARISDAIADPPGAERDGVERIVRLPRAFHAWQPMAEARRDPMPPAEAPFTFGSFNNALKLSVPCIALWARILAGAPRARLHLKCRSFMIAAFAARVRAAFAAHGIAPDRLLLDGSRPPPAAHFAAYDLVDLALDPFPYNGTTTTLEALWMGVPVLTRGDGEGHAARVGASLLTQVGRPDLVAGDGEAYVAAALAAAERPRPEARARLDLRAQLAGSPLCDARGLAAALEAVYRAETERKRALAGL